MTIPDCDRQIRSQQAAMDGFHASIQDAENKINELNQLRNKIANLDDVVKSAASRSYGQISSIHSVWGKARAAINNSFFSSVLGTIKGGEYAAAVGGLSSSIDRIDEEIRTLNHQIQQNRNNISNCKNSISNLEYNKNILIMQKRQEQEKAQ